MDFEWDAHKAKANLLKHEVDFADAVQVFEDFHALTIEDRDHDEERFVTMGTDAYGRILVVAYTYRGENIIRIISARKAEKREIKEYYQGVKS